MLRPDTGRDTCGREGAWWMSSLSMPRPLSHPLCCFSLLSNLERRQGSKGLTRLVCLLSSVWQIPKCWLFFSPGELLCVPQRQLTTPRGYFVLWYLGWIFTIPTLASISKITPWRLFSTLWSRYPLVNTFKRPLYSTCLMTLKKLSTFSVLKSGSACLCLHRVPLYSPPFRPSFLNLHAIDIWG